MAKTPTIRGGKVQIHLQTPHEIQAKILDESKRYNVVCGGRRLGKSQLLINRALDKALAGYQVGWFSPTYRMMIEIWRDLIEACRPVISRVSTQENRIELITGGVIEMWSMENPDSCRGRKYKRIIVDEAAQMSNLMEAWMKVLSPTLMDMEGDAWFASTPRGHNAFWTFFTYGLPDGRPDWMCWQVPTSANPYISPNEIESMRMQMPDNVYRQEILAQFVDDGSGVFRNVEKLSTAEHQFDPIPSHVYVMGIDLARYNDFSVIMIFDATIRAFVHYDRFTNTDFNTQERRMKDLYYRFRPVQVIIESNSISIASMEELQRGKQVTRTDVVLVSDGKHVYAYHQDGVTKEGPWTYDTSQPDNIPYNPAECRHGKVIFQENPHIIKRDIWYGGEWLDGLPVQPFIMTNATKIEAVDTLALAFERQSITLINDPTFKSELQAYELTRTPSGLLRYAAPKGLHDDIVTAALLAYSGADSGTIEYAQMPPWWR
jgi:hypothetical protein